MHCDKKPKKKRIEARVSVQGVESLLKIYSGRLGVIVVDLCYFALFEDFSQKNDKKCKSISIFSLKNDNNFFYFLLHKIQTPGRHKHAKWPPSDLTPWALTLGSTQ